MYTQLCVYICIYAPDIVYHNHFVMCFGNACFGQHLKRDSLTLINASPLAEDVPYLAVHGCHC